MENKLKKGDVYHFQWNEEEYQKDAYINHCFERVLVVRDVKVYNDKTKKYESKVRLVDTYWGISGDGRKFTLEEANKKGTLVYYCNLNDLEPIEKYYLDDYADTDLFTISKQHACVESCIFWFKKKGAKKNPEKKIRVLQEKVNDREREISHAISDIKYISAQIKQLEIKGFKE